MQITELTLFTDNISETKNFYGNILSLKIISQSDNQVGFQAGSTKLIFKECKNTQKPFYHFAFNIPSNKLTEAIGWMAEKVNLLPTDENSFIANFKNWNAKSIYFFDAAGNIAELISRFDLKNETGEKFNSSQILCVSEIGIVSNDLHSIKQKLINDYKVSDFVKSVNSDTFSAMGDDNGLLILAVENRNWYPTTMPSQKSPFQIKFINDLNESYVITEEIV
ncbi:MAG: glyoxalase [Ignavibacteria bacterium]|nr:glyoxalase [Ignavibacteria bacterium]